MNTYFSGGEKRRPEIRLRSQAIPLAFPLTFGLMKCLLILRNSAKPVGQFLSIDTRKDSIHMQMLIGYSKQNV